MPRLIIFITAVLCLSPLTGWRSEASTPQHDGVRVDQVNDGDTITVLIGRRHERVRLIGIDAPELGQRPWGERARSHLRRLIEASGWTVRLQYDFDRRDKYRRRLAYVWTAGGKMVNEEMLRFGYAVLFTLPPNVRHVDRLRSAQQEARRTRAGIWSREGLKDLPARWRRQHPSYR